ncbi:UNVERIFIED_CONTAM: hypothetical protein FKN15_044220 [Acipenser sinensis]
MSASDETDALRPRYGSVLDSVERLTAEEMDERRQQNMAYEYLCHLEEAKRWMEACLDEELPPTTELEEGLRNGVYLAKLGNFFSPRVVSLKKIYDREQTRYKATGLHFRHTDNVIQWLNAMNEIGLPKIFYPETTDIYDRKNMPRSIYCIHALSLYLFKLGLAPQIQDLYGKVDFTEEEINNMKSELEKYGIQMPAFSKIGGILANELSVDEAALHAAVIAINDAIDHGEPGGTMAAMRNPNAMLVNLDEGSSQRYQHTLQQAKQDKVANARKRITGENSQEERDVYEELLTQAEIQGNVNKVNLLNSLETVDRALRGGDEAALYDALRSQALGLRRLQPDNKDWYLKQLSADREAKEQKEELQNGVDLATDDADRYQKMLRAVDRINTAVRGGVAEETVSELMNPEAQLPQVYPSASDLYQRELSTLQQQSPEGSLTHPELLVAVEMLSSVALINRALDTGDRQAVWKQLESSVTGLSNVEDENAQRYIDDLTRLKVAARAEGNPFLTWNDIQACVDQVNGTVQEEHERIIAIGLINEALDHGNAQTTLAALQHPAAKLSEVRPPVAQHYHDTLVRARREKAQDTQDDSAVLWLDEIQDGVCSSNKETEDSQQFSLGILGINEAVERGDTAQTLAALRSPDVGLYGIDDIVKIQAFIRANKARDDYKTLINAADPPMAVVRKFVHLLDQSDQDFQEELELMRLREEVVTQIRSNQQLENDLNLMDIKIGLLVKNKITLQEVVSHSKKLTKKNKGQLSDMMMMNKQGGLKALSKAKREKLEAYQFLFYLLQTNPTYLAKLIFQMPQNKSTKFMDSVIFTLYNYASNQREEYLLLKLFKTALQEEIKSKVDQIQEIVTGNPTVIKMVVSFNRGARGQNALRQILAPVVKETMDDKALSIKTDPVDIYKSWVNQMESQTGEASKLPYDVTPEQALSHEEVRTRLDASIKHMRTVTDKFLSAITVSVDKIPYGMRFIAKVLKDTLHEKFPDATEDELLKVQFQKVQQLQLTQTRAQYYGGSLPNVNQIGNTSADFQGSFTPGLDSMRGTRHHGLVERVSRDRSRLNSPHRRLADKLGRQISFTDPTFSLDLCLLTKQQPAVYLLLAAPLHIDALCHTPSNHDERQAGTNSDSALHTSALNPNPQDPFVGMNQQMSRAPPQRNVSVNEAEIDGMGDVFSFPALPNEESLMGVSKPLPKQLWEAKKNAGLSHFQGTLNTGGSLPDLTNLHFPSPLPTPLDPEDGGYPSLSGGSSTGNLPAAMMHLGIGNSQGLSSSLSNPSIQATLNNSQLHSSLSNPSIHSSLRLSSLSNPQQGALSNTPRRRHTPVSPLTLSPGAEQRRGLGMQLSPTMSPSLSPITQHNSLGAFFYDPFMDTQLSGRQSKSLSYQLDQFNMLENSMSSLPGGSCFDPGSNLCYSQASLMGLGGSHGNLQESLQLRQNMFFSNCGGGIPNIILTDESNPSLSKDISSALAGVPECFDSEGEFLGNELRIEPLSLDGLSMLSDPDMVLPDPSVEDSFRSDRL